MSQTQKKPIFLLFHTLPHPFPFISLFFLLPFFFLFIPHLLYIQTIASAVFLLGEERTGGVVLVFNAKPGAWEKECGVVGVHGMD